MLKNTSINQTRKLTKYEHRASNDSVRQVISLSKFIRQTEPSDIFAEFDKLSDEFKVTSAYDVQQTNDAAASEKLTPLQQRRKTRSERLDEKRLGNFTQSIITKAETVVTGLAQLFNRKKSKTTNSVHEAENHVAAAETKAKSKSKPKQKAKKRIRVYVKRVVLTLFCIGFIGVIGASVFVYSIVREAADIEPGNINELLHESSILLDRDGNVIDNIFGNHGEGRRTNITFEDLPSHLYSAFVAVEDRTFWEHSGLNVIRMVGAVRDAAIGDGRIRGTSTITQQLARNIYLPDTRLERSLDRKILEIYYAIIIERHLTKEQILEAYLNTIQLGFETSGVQAAAQAYFSKDVHELNLVQSVALAALPQAPSAYALVRRVPNDSVAEDNPNILLRGSVFTYLYNGDASAHRRTLILRLMREQGFITDAEFYAASNESLRDHLNPRQNLAAENSSFFIDFVRQQVLEDLQREFNITAEQAVTRLNNHGLRIYTTLDSNTQAIIETEFANPENFPSVNFSRDRDSAGNILGQGGNILLYNIHNYFDEYGNFTLTPNEFERLPDGSLRIFRGNRLNFFRTEVHGNVDYSVEFRDMYVIEDGIFYSISGGFISIARQYKTRDSDGNLIVSANFFQNQPNFFTESDAGLTIAPTGYALQQRVIQPQSAMVILDHNTGYIKAMVGGRNIIGRLLFNRADQPRQPGSALKPIGVYAPALQLSFEAARDGTTQFPLGEGEPLTHLYGDFWTAASVLDDSPLIVGGRQWPRNWYNAFRGLNSMRVAIEQSINVTAVKAFNEIGAYTASDFLKRLGVTSIVDSGPVNDMNAAALALGGMTRGISPLEMAAAYGAVANRGLYVAPISYTRVTNQRGDILLENSPATLQAMDPGVAFIMQDMLRTNVTEGTNRHAAIGIQPVAGKTGTTNDNFDAWFVGFTPQYSASLWIGNDVNIRLSQGSVAASRLWSRIMRQVSEGIPTGQFASAPPNVISVTIDRTSGLLPSDISHLGHRGTRSEFFIRGTEPTRVDDVHTFVTICRHTGHLATPLCEDVTSAFGIRRPYMPNPAVGDFRFEVPHFYCFVHNPDENLFPINTNAPWTFNWEGMEITREPDPEEYDPYYYPTDILPDDVDAIWPPPTYDPPPDMSTEENTYDDIYDDIPDFLRDW